MSGPNHHIKALLIPPSPAVERKLVAEHIELECTVLALLYHGRGQRKLAYIYEIAAAEAAQKALDAEG